MKRWPERINILEAEMAFEIVVVITQISSLKIKMGQLWDERGRIDPEILGLSMEIDRLINQYYRLLSD